MLYPRLEEITESEYQKCSSRCLEKKATSKPEGLIYFWAEFDTGIRSYGLRRFAVYGGVLTASHILIGELSMGARHLLGAKTFITADMLDDVPKGKRIYIVPEMLKPGHGVYIAQAKPSASTTSPAISAFSKLKNLGRGWEVEPVLCSSRSRTARPFGLSRCVGNATIPSTRYPHRLARRLGSAT